MKQIERGAAEADDLNGSLHGSGDLRTHCGNPEIAHKLL